MYFNTRLNKDLGTTSTTIITITILLLFQDGGVHGEVTCHVHTVSIRFKRKAGLHTFCAKQHVSKRLAAVIVAT